MSGIGAQSNQHSQCCPICSHGASPRFGEALRYLIMDSQLLASILQLAGGLAGFCVLCLGAVLVHEAGHAVAAVLCGLRIMAVQVGPIEFTQNKSLRSVRPRFGVLSGFVQVHFRKVPGRWAAWQCAAFIVAGPLANLCPALVVVPLLRSDSVAANIGFLFLLVSVFFGTVQLIPFRTRGARSDGANLFLLLFSKRKRAEIVFLRSFLAHTDEVFTLYRAGQITSACDKAEILIRNCNAIPDLGSNADLMNRLANLRDGLRNKMNGAEIPQQEASAIPI